MFIECLLSSTVEILEKKKVMIPIPNDCINWKEHGQNTMKCTVISAIMGAHSRLGGRKKKHLNLFWRVEEVFVVEVTIEICAKSLR